ncbi:MAG: ECF transporter S component [Oscillospiraceae bacterium]|jgi:uncharacterized membrane protein|nr:ECF transporter S component [Oscillospiraceae bacterium]
MDENNSNSNVITLNRGKTEFLTVTGILLAVLLMFHLTGIGYIPINPAFELTIMMVPVVVGAMTKGKLCGAILGTAFGLSSFIMAFVSPLGIILLAANPLFTFIALVLTRTLTGFLVGLLFDLFKKIDKQKAWCHTAAAIIGSLLNTVLFLGAIILLFGNLPAVKDGVIPILATLIFTNGIIEAAVCGVCGGTIAASLKQYVFKSN